MVTVITVSQKTFRTVIGTALGSLSVIIFTGAMVRLTGSGLGCADWPRCNATKFVDVSTGHTLIEQANRKSAQFEEARKAQMDFIYDTIKKGGEKEKRW